MMNSLNADINYAKYVIKKQCLWSGHHARQYKISKTESSAHHLWKQATVLLLKSVV